MKTEVDGYDQNERLFDRATILCRLCMRVLRYFQSFRTYVDDGLADAGKMCGANDSPKQLREILEELRVTAQDQNSPTGQDVWMLLPGIEVANSASLRSIRCGDNYDSTATEAVFHLADALHGEVSSSCLWLPGDDPKWGGRVIDVSTLQPYQDVMNRIQERLTAKSLTEDRFRELEAWIDQERIRTRAYWCDTHSPPPKPVERRTAKELADAIRKRLATLADGDEAGSGQGKADGEPPKPEGSATQVEVPALSDKQYLILQTMLELNALSADTRKTADEIAKAADGKQADLNVFKPLLSDLTKKHKLTESKTGSGGGSWLTPLGIAVTNRVLENGKANVSKQ